MCLSKSAIHTFLGPFEDHEHYYRTYYICDDVRGVQAVSRVLGHVQQTNIGCITTVFITTGPWCSELAHSDLSR